LASQLALSFQLHVVDTHFHRGSSMCVCFSPQKINKLINILHYRSAWVNWIESRAVSLRNEMVKASKFQRMETNFKLMAKVKQPIDCARPLNWWGKHKYLQIIGIISRITRQRNKFESRKTTENSLFILIIWYEHFLVSHSQVLGLNEYRIQPLFSMRIGLMKL